jgi:cob(I)alamin adenosyltransferase
MRDCDMVKMKGGTVMKRSCVQIYTGNGKGKTTAAMGLALRAAGGGLSVKVVQFLKGRDSGEVQALERLGVEVCRVSSGSKFYWDMNDAEKAQLRHDVRNMLTVIGGWLDEIDVLILDEALGALYCGALELKEVINIIELRGGTEIVLTGRNAPDELIRLADLVTEMQPVKHYMDMGVPARKGIEF